MLSLMRMPPGEALGRNIVERYLPIIDEQTRQVVENPVARALREGRGIGLDNHLVLVARDGREIRRG